MKFPQRFDAWFASLDYWDRAAYCAFWVIVGMAIGLMWVSQ